MVYVICSGCNKSFDKPKKEHDRQVRLGRVGFYCDRACFGRCRGKDNLGEGCRSPEHLLKIGVLAAKSRTKFFDKDDKVFGEMLRRARHRKKGPSDLDVEYLKSLWGQQQHRCHLTGITLSLEGNDPVVRASLDRIDSKQGYVKGNVQFISCSINWAKNSGTNDDIRRLVMLIMEASRL